MVAPSGPALRRWAIATGAGAAVVTAADAVLLERSKGFLRGGFLSIDYLEGPLQTALFFGVSLLVDAALVGLIVAMTAWVLNRAGLRPLARTLAGALAGAGALLAYDVATYQILQFLGDAFDLRLMFDLAGGRVSEIFAVASGQLLGPAIVAVAACGAAGATVWAAHHYSSPAPAGRGEPVLVPVLLGVAGVVVLGAACTSSDVLENGLLRKPSGQAFAALVNAVTDVDRDGYGIIGRSSDPDPFDASVYPYAAEVAGNGVDEDGVGGDLPAPAAAYRDPAMPSAPWARTPDVLLVVLEGFRADLLGARFEGKPITPVLDALAQRGYSSPAAYSHNGYTVQSRFHIFSGVIAGKPGAATLVDDFKSHGYRVGYFSGQDESFGGPLYAIGYARADEAADARTDRTRRYSTASTPGSLAVPMAVVEEHVAGFLQHSRPETPLLLCVNFHDTHFPYTHPAIETITSGIRLPREDIVPGERDRLWATYVNTAANVDRAIGRVIDAVRAARGREPGVIVTSDHGESLFDEGFLGHGYALNDTQTRVPVVVANLPLVLPEPMMQSELRPALLEAMASADGTRKPGGTPRGGAPMFQYLGDLSRPRQLAFVGGKGRILYDFRSGRVKTGDGDWMVPGQLPKAEREEFLALVQFWERVQLARLPAWKRTDGDG